MKLPVSADNLGSGSWAAWLDNSLGVISRLAPGLSKHVLSFTLDWGNLPCTPFPQLVYFRKQYKRRTISCLIPSEGCQEVSWFLARCVSCSRLNKLAYLGLEFNLWLECLWWHICTSNNVSTKPLVLVSDKCESLALHSAWGVLLLVPNLSLKNKLYHLSKRPALSIVKAITGSKISQFLLFYLC